VTETRAKHLILILARELASNLATPTVIADAEGMLVFFNEAAEEIVGSPFSEIGEMPIHEFSASFSPRTRNQKPLTDERRPTRIALEERRAAHEQVWVTSRDGVDRQVAITAIPLFAQADEFVGMIAVFWRE
jgi:PAS domain S-box-containing protein